MSADAVLPSPRRRRDPVVKLTHWSIALAVLANAGVTEEGSAPHVWVGYGLAGILALRLFWGLIGPPEARFSAFPPSPARALAHVRDIAAGQRIEHRSHNPLGALMVYSMWACLAVIIGSGVAMAGLPRTLDLLPATSVSSPADQADRNDDATEDRAAMGGEHGDGRKRRKRARWARSTKPPPIYSMA